MTDPLTPVFSAEEPSHPVPTGLKSTFSKLFGSSWGNTDSSTSSSNADSGGGLIAAFRAIMPKISSSDSVTDGSSPRYGSSDSSRTGSPGLYGPPPPLSPGHKSTLLAICPQLPPPMHRREWCMSDYVITDKLYKGYASTVYKAICKRSREVVVLKCYLMSSICELYQHQIYREVRLHSSCAHENIVKLYAAFQEGDRVVMVQEYADGGDLFSLLQKYGGCLSERVAVQMVLDPFLRVLQYLHTRAIIHRDIKPENILFSESGSCLKLADFGLAIDLREERAVTRAGTLDYMAPEVLKCPYKSKPEENKEKAHLHYSNTVDSWAVGVLVYELLVGCPPFFDRVKSTTEARIVSGVPYFPPTMSEAAKNFICAALRKNPEERPSVLEMVHHPWVELFRMRRSMRQISTLNIVAAAPSASASSFSGDQVAAAAAAAGAAVAGFGPAGAIAAAAAAPAIGPKIAAAVAANGPAAPPSNVAGACSSAAAAAAAALSAARKSIKHSVTHKTLLAATGPLQRLEARLGQKDDLALHLSAASSPCLLQTPGGTGANSLLKAAIANNAANSAALRAQAVPTPAAAPAPAAVPAAVPASAAVAGLPGPGLIKGGSLKIDEEQMTFLFSGARAAAGLASQVSLGKAAAAAVANEAAAALREAELQQQEVMIRALY